MRVIPPPPSVTVIEEYLVVCKPTWCPDSAGAGRRLLGALSVRNPCTFPAIASGLGTPVQVSLLPARPPACPLPAGTPARPPVHPLPARPPVLAILHLLCH